MTQRRIVSLFAIAVALAKEGMTESINQAKCEDGTFTCAVPPEVQASSMLMKNSHMAKSTILHSDSTCGPLELSGFVLEGCDSLVPDTSCKVSCSAGLVGEPVRYFCFSQLAASGAPPAALAPPVCHNATSAAFTQDKVMALAWGDKGCLECKTRYKQCDLLPDAEVGDERCTLFKLDMATGQIQWTEELGQCIDMYGGPAPGLWHCNGGDNQDFVVEPSEVWPNAKVLCVKSNRGKMCFNAPGEWPVRFFDTAPDAALLEPAFAALAEGHEDGFLQQVYANQVCRARLESGVPDSFWAWLKTKDYNLVQALFSTYPVHPGQVKLFHEIGEAVGHEKFESMGMDSFAVALSFVNRFMASIDEVAQAPHPNYEDNDFDYLAEDKERIKQEMIEGKHCLIVSNECRDLHKCCGSPESWNFSWPRDPSPSVRDWVEFWLSKVEDHADGLWMNPVQEVPWMFAVYLWPAPITECEWVQRKLIHGEEMQGSWYLYDSSFHKRICAGGEYHPDSLPGIAVYGGVCGRMANLESRKSSCMGQPATVKGEPGHCAGFKYKSETGIFTTLNVITDVSHLFTMKPVPIKYNWVTVEVVRNSEAFPNTTASCVKCSSWTRCTFIPAGSEDCSKFSVDAESKRLKLSTGGNQCFTMFGGPDPGLWICATGSHGDQDWTVNADGEKVITSNKGTLRLRTSAVPPEPEVDECLACKKSWKACEFALPNSTDCTKFYYEEDTTRVRFASTSQCLGMFSGPKPGSWSCNTASAQKAPVQDDGLLRYFTNKGDKQYRRIDVDRDLSELGRCVVCKKAWKVCEFAAAGSPDCTEFVYNPSKSRIEVGSQCLSVYSGPTPGLWSCHGKDTQHVELDEQGRLKFESSSGTMHMHVPLGGAMPNISTRWTYGGFHEIECTKSNCHYHSAMHLDSKELTQKRHKETALADLEAYNDYAKHGLYPTAHDEARLAASLVFALRKDGVVSDEKLEPVLAWALRRNPALFEAWELAAEFATGGALNASDMPSRDALASHEWWKELSLLRLRRVSSSLEQEKADRFAREHLLGSKTRWVQFSQLHRRMVGRLCGALSDDVLQELGETSEQCQLLLRLQEGLGWEDAEEEMLEADALGQGNMPSENFLMYWEVLARLAVSPGEHTQGEKLKTFVEYLLEKLTIGYINERSQTFFTEHKRLMLHAPYAFTLQLAGATLAKERREEILQETKAVLEDPVAHADKLWASSEDVQEAFMDWASRHAPGGRAVFEESSAADGVNGFSSSDEANPQVMKEMVLDRDGDMELGATFWHETWPTEAGERRYEILPLLSSLLRLEADGTASPESSQEDNGLSAAALAQRAAQHAAKRSRARAGPTPTELVQYCMEDLFAPR